MTTSNLELQPEEFAQAAAEAIADALDRTSREAATVLANAGLLGICADETDEGLGLGIEFALPIAIEAGRLQLPFPLLEQMLVARALKGSPLAVELCRGEKLACYALQGSIEDGWAGHARYVNECDWVLVAEQGGGAALCDLAYVGIEPDAALDPEHSQSWLTLTTPRVLARIDDDAFLTLQRDMQVLVAGFVHGAAAGALARTADYMSTRVQFGRPVSSKQSVRHLLARMCLACETTNASVHRVLRADEYGAPRDTRAPLAHAIAQAAFVLEKAIHLHGGMGFTWELPLHRSLRDIRKFDAAFGSGDLSKRVGSDFIASV
ncbi:MAG: Acyl-CoA dehydrogenase, C-terminal domain [Rhodoferax sp.]|nr:Acyl-CoA dehydrogenase, C-terminal domain [Rhodoferax sp.]